MFSKVGESVFFVPAKSNGESFAFLEYVFFFVYLKI